MFKQLRYDGTSAYESDSHLKESFKQYSRSEYIKELYRRADYEKNRKELLVYYYRIGYTLAFPLPLCEMPLDMPEGIPERSYYPWSIWLTWELRERWYTLCYAWRTLKDVDAGNLLQNELASLSKWSTYFDGPGDAGLCTGHLASCLAEFLSDRADWDPKLYSQAEVAAHTLLDTNILPWFANNWEKKLTLTEENLANIPCIVLFCSANLARVVGSRYLNILDSKAMEILKTWCRCRMEAVPYTEGTAYDAYFLDAALEWVDVHPDKDSILTMAKPALETAYKSWINLALPGRPDIHAPLGDVEPEMPFWMNTLERVSVWYGWEEGLWLLSHIYPIGLTSRVLGCLQVHLPKTIMDLKEPVAAPTELVSAVVLRTGWKTEDVLVAIAYGRTKTGHLHFDNGSIVIGRYGRFWITDPGYQQYRPGEERDFSIGSCAHNVPVISKTGQSTRKAKLISISGADDQQKRAYIDLTKCYENIEGVTGVTREIYLLSNSNIVAVCDKFKLSCDTKEVEYSWQIGTHFACSYTDGWGRISDESHALWIGCSHSSILPTQLKRHSGSRGPLNILKECTVTDKNPVIWWIFCFDNAGSWKPPLMEFTHEGLKLYINQYEEII